MRSPKGANRAGAGIEGKLSDILPRRHKEKERSSLAAPSCLAALCVMRKVKQAQGWPLESAGRAYCHFLPAVLQQKGRRPQHTMVGVACMEPASRLLDSRLATRREHHDIRVHNQSSQSHQIRRRQISIMRFFPTGTVAAAAAAAAAASIASHAGAAIPPSAAGTWAITETRGGQKCTANLMLQPVRLAQSAEDLSRGAARYQGVCVDSADGSWVVQQEDAAAPRLAWKLEYEKSTVFFAADLEGDGSQGKGSVYAAPRADPKAIKRVGEFTAKKVTSAWDLRDPVVSRRVTDKML
jgi:hypothetical protein